MTRKPTYHTVAETVDELRAAGLDDVGPDAVRRWVRAEKVPALKLPSGEYRIRDEVVQAIIRGEDPHDALRAVEKAEGIAA